jgi:transcriptional regulator with XRE-family HTH domain
VTETGKELVSFAGVVKLAKLKRARERAALSQEELAKKAGVSRVTVARVEACLDDPQPRTVRKLAAALGVEPEALMEADG